MEKNRRERSRGAKCRFCREGIVVDYKDIETLTKLTSGQGKISSRKRSGNCAGHQRLVQRAVKRARFIALMPYVV
jgi:small subunit ribosomal protein S18